MSAPERSAPAVEPVLEGRRAPGASGAGADQRTLRGLVRYFLKLGASGFGGPIALVGYMQRDLVEERRWFSQTEFEQAVAVGQTMPGPLAAQAAMWFGYLHAGARARRIGDRAPVRDFAVSDRHRFECRSKRRG